MRSGTRPATPSNPLVGEIKDQRRRWYPVELLAQQGLRTVAEIVGWIEAGKLRGHNGSNGWIVHLDQLDTWRELCKTEPRVEPTVFRTMRALLDAHPDLRPLYDERRAAAFGQRYDFARHLEARRVWDAALRERGIGLQFGHPGFGFAGRDVPDFDEAGFDPVDRHRADIPSQQGEDA
jgi:hypothetical protein